jgi:multiple antibiotic resistance protein
VTDVASAVITLVLVMDPLGNVPLFLSILSAVPQERRRRVLLRENAIAYLVLMLFLFTGGWLLRLLGLELEAVGMAGGIVLFLIALRMVFPDQRRGMPQPAGDPFIVPLAVPLIAGPSTLATLLLLDAATPTSRGWLLLAVTIAWAIGAVILMSSTVLYRVLGERGLMALERLMGMLLVMIAVQMLVNGIRRSLVPGS